MVGARQGKAPLPDAIVAIDRIERARGIAESTAGLRLGALVTHEALVASAVIRERFTALADASAIVGSHATRAQGTIGGNVMNASPAMDTGGPLLCFGRDRRPCARRRRAVGGAGRPVDGAGDDGRRAGRAARRDRRARAGPGTGSAYVRLEYRRQMEIAVVVARPRW